MIGIAPLYIEDSKWIPNYILNMENEENEIKQEEKKNDVEMENEEKNMKKLSEYAGRICEQQKAKENILLNKLKHEWEINKNTQKQFKLFQMSLTIKKS